MICGERRGRRGQSGMCQNMTHSIFFEHFSDWTGFECCLGTGGGRYAKTTSITQSTSPSTLNIQFYVPAKLG